MSFFFFPSSTYRNCSFTIECLKNSLQILCIYAELLNSAVCCSFFFGAFGVSGGSETVTTSARRPPGPRGSALLDASPLPGSEPRQGSAVRGAPVYLCIVYRSAEMGGAWGCSANCRAWSQPGPIPTENPKCTKPAPYFQSGRCRSV